MSVSLPAVCRSICHVCYPCCDDKLEDLQMNSIIYFAFYLGNIHKVFMSPLRITIDIIDRREAGAWTVPLTALPSFWYFNGLVFAQNTKHFANRWILNGWDWCQGIDVRADPGNGAKLFGKALACMYNLLVYTLYDTEKWSWISTGLISALESRLHFLPLPMSRPSRTLPGQQCVAWGRPQSNTISLAFTETGVYLSLAAWNESPRFAHCFFPWANKATIVSPALANPLTHPTRWELRPLWTSPNRSSVPRHSLHGLGCSEEEVMYIARELKPMFKTQPRVYSCKKIYLHELTKCRSMIDTHANRFSCRLYSLVIKRDKKLFEAKSNSTACKMIL